MKRHHTTDTARPSKLKQVETAEYEQTDEAAAPAPRYESPLSTNIESAPPAYVVSLM
jgi:hypothetical protein